MIGKNKLYTALLSVAALLIAVGLAEATFRWFAPHGYYIWPPNWRANFEPAPNALPGVFGESKIVTNEWGIRGAPFSDADRYRVLAVGGSTTECLYLDDSEAWPHLVETRLNADRFEPHPVWVGNVGRSGHNTSHHLLQVEKALGQYPRIDLVLLLVGVNDLMPVLENGHYTPPTEKELEAAFSIQPGLNLEDASYAFYKRTEIWRTLRRVRDNLFSETKGALIQDRAGSVFVTLRERRHGTYVYLDDLPDLTAALAVYKANLNAIVDSVQRRGIRIVLMTQPSLWAGEMTADADRLIWMGRNGPHMGSDIKGYYSSAALERGMSRYNEMLLQVCKERSLQCVDLAAAVPKASDVFYDDVHFTEAGSRMVADIVADFLEHSRQTW